jgi:CPA2 family monovalent cation:H+ antiporter-2
MVSTRLARTLVSTMNATLATILVLLGASVVVVVVARLARLPPILGYLVAGVLVGPHVLGWVEDSAAIRHLADFGIVFLMFSLGLEFSLPQLVSMRRAVFGLGLAQVAITTLAGLIALPLAGFGWRGQRRRRSPPRSCRRCSPSGWSSRRRTAAT